MPITRGLNIEIEFPTWPEEVSERDFNRFGRESMRAAIRQHHHTVIPEKYKPGAARKYGYKQRSTRYNEQKQRKYGHKLELVKTGRSKARMTKRRLLDNDISVRGSSVGGTLTGFLKLYFNFSQKKGGKNRPRRFRPIRIGGIGLQLTKGSVSIDDMRSEIAKTLEPERKAFAEKFKAEFIRLLEQKIASKKRRRKRVKGL